MMNGCLPPNAYHRQTQSNVRMHRQTSKTQSNAEHELKFNENISQSLSSQRNGLAFMIIFTHIWGLQLKDSSKDS